MASFQGRSQRKTQRQSPFLMLMRAAKELKWAHLETMRLSKVREGTLRVRETHWGLETRKGRTRDQALALNRNSTYLLVLNWSILRSNRQKATEQPQYSLGSIVSGNDPCICSQRDSAKPHDIEEHRTCAMPTMWQAAAP